MSATLTYSTQLDAVLAQANRLAQTGPAWLQTLRARGLEQFNLQGLPTPKNEEWKYTPLRAVSETAWTPGEPGPAVFDQELGSLSGSPIRIVLVNGRFDRNLSEIPAQPGLTAISLRDALTEHADKLEGTLGTLAKIENHPFAALNTALFEDGLYLELAKGAMIEPVIEIVHVTSGAGQVFAPRMLLVAHEAAVAQIVERYISDGEGVNLTLPVTESIIHNNANVEHVRVQDEATTNFHIGLWESHQAVGSEYKAYNVAYGAALGRLDQNLWLGGRHVTTRLDGVVVARGTQLLDNHTRLDHAMPDGNSFEVYKQIVDDEATVVFNGKIFVHQDAQKTDAKQTNQTLLLAPTATINSKPQLEIFADDVKCTHGATVGQLETLPLFYLRSRGMPKKQAEAILVYAFAAEVLELINDESVKKALEARLFEKLALE